MKKIVIVSPHFPPSNLAAVHRSRLFAKHLPSFEWEPIILTVHHDYYEEALDWNLYKLIPKSLRIESAKAIPIQPLRVIGDVGLRGGLFMYKKLLRLVREEKINFVYILIPSFYGALLGRAIHIATGVPYGIDYIDPWVHRFAGSDKKFSRHWWSTKLSNYLEPIAVKEASLITGVAEGYYKPVLDRNPHLYKQAIQASMPYGGEAEDHKALLKLKLKPYLFNRKKGTFLFVYAGAMLPRAYPILDRIFSLIQANEELFKGFEFHFIGTGKSANDHLGHTIKPYAQKNNLWESVVFEYPRRIPYLDVLTHLSIADGIFILGSTEPHYTPSKVYQGILSEKPILAVLHRASSASQVIKNSRGGIVLNFNGEADLNTISSNFLPVFETFKSFVEEFNSANVDRSAFEQYSAYNVTKALAHSLNLALERSNYVG